MSFDKILETPDPETTAALKLSVIIPMFNEEEGLEKTLRRVSEELFTHFKQGAWEVIVVNDGSTDDTWRLARKLAKRKEFSWLRVEGYYVNRGRGRALRTGFAAAQGEWIVSIDADLTYDPHYIVEMTDVLRDDAETDVVMASVYMPGGRAENLSLKRYLPSRWGNVVLSWFMSSGNQKIYTITCVVRAYRRKVLDSLELESDGKDIHLEIVSKALMLGYQFKEIPAVLKSRSVGTSKFQFKNTATSHLIFALFERPILVFGLLGMLLLLGSMCGMAYILYVYFHPLRELNPNRPLMTIIVLTFLGGLQLISFGVMGTQFVNMRKEIIKIQARLRHMAKHVSNK